MTNKIDLNAFILNAEGEQVGDMTVRKAIIVAFQALHPDDESMSGDEKYGHFQIMQKVAKAPTVALSLQEKSMIKERIGKVMTPVIVGRVWPILDESLVQNVEEE
jgi:hypothetical protein